MIAPIIRMVHTNNYVVLIEFEALVAIGIIGSENVKSDSIVWGRIEGFVCLMLEHGSSISRLFDSQPRFALYQLHGHKPSKFLFSVQD